MSRKDILASKLRRTRIEELAEESMEAPSLARHELSEEHLGHVSGGLMSNCCCCCRCCCCC